MAFKVVIIDDDIQAVDFLNELLVECFDDILVADKVHNVDDGIAAINKFDPDLVLLDVEMPYSNGFEVLEAFPDRSFEVIFITAYSDYAIKAFRYSAIDYLLKPVEIDGFILSVNKVIERKINKKSKPDLKKLLENIKLKIPKKVAIQTSQGFEYIDVNDIIKIVSETEKKQINVFLDNGSNFLVNKTIGEYEDLLSDNNFYRSHNSFLINLNHIKTFVKDDGGYIIMSDNSKVSISRRRKDDFLLLMDSQLAN